MGEKEVSQKAAMETKVDKLNLLTFEAVGKVKSIRRAIRRHNVAPFGVMYPKRPFNNRKNKPLEAVKRSIYHGIKQSQSRAIATA